jgi:hypothetical protein
VSRLVRTRSGVPYVTLDATTKIDAVRKPRAGSVADNGSLSIRTQQKQKHKYTATYNRRDSVETWGVVMQLIKNGISKKFDRGVEAWRKKNVRTTKEGSETSD